MESSFRLGEYLERATSPWSALGGQVLAGVARVPTASHGFGWNQMSEKTITHQPQPAKGWMRLPAIAVCKPKECCVAGFPLFSEDTGPPGASSNGSRGLSRQARRKYSFRLIHAVFRVMIRLTIKDSKSSRLLRRYQGGIQSYAARVGYTR